MRHLNKAVSKATVIDFAHIKVFVHPLVNRQLVPNITCNRYKPLLVVPLIANGVTGVHLFWPVIFILSIKPTGRRTVVAFGIVKTMLTQEVDVVNASAVSTALPVDVDTGVFPWVNLAVLVQVFYCV